MLDYFFKKRKKCSLFHKESIVFHEGMMKKGSGYKGSQTAWEAQVPHLHVLSSIPSMTDLGSSLWFL